VGPRGSLPGGHAVGEGLNTTTDEPLPPDFETEAVIAVLVICTLMVLLAVYTHPLI